MKRKFTLALLVSIVPGLLTSFTAAPGGKSASLNPQYIVLAWNDLGMHCANQDFSNMCILPPYNNQTAQVIFRGSPTSLPAVLNGTSGIYLTYEIPVNTQSATKTNFWSYAQQLFGVALPPNVGLAGFGMSGPMPAAAGNYFHAEGIPVTAYPDATPTVQDPYQLTLIKVFSASNELLATTQSVIPVSHEINCVSSGCHTSELNILQMHDPVSGFNINNRPIFCADCHSDNALGKPGMPGVPSFSQVMHLKHGEFITGGTSDDCYKCHPGPNTQCWRDVMHGSPGGITKCQDCHGSTYQVGKSIEEDGREPWLEEPSCGAAACHGPAYAEEPGKLFRNSKGHGSLYCSACHGSPHAIFPTGNERDNLQNTSLQGHAGTLSDCAVCHGYYPSGPGPHGIMNSTVQNISVGSGLTSCYPASGFLRVAGNGTAVTVQSGGNATFVAGLAVNFLPGTTAAAGSYLHGYITTNNQYCPAPAAPLTGGEATQGPRIAKVESFTVTAYPNPTTGMITVEIAGAVNDRTFHMDIFTGRGEKTGEGSFLSGGTRSLLLDGPAGIYLLRVTSGDETRSVKVVKQ